MCCYSNNDINSICTGYDPDIPFAVLGPVCSIATKLMASLASNYLDTVHVSFGALSPLFSDVNTYSYFYRTIPSYSSYNKPIFAIMQHFDWQFVGVVHAEDSFYTTALEDLASLFLAQNSPAQIRSSVGIAAHLELDVENFAKNVRIYIAMLEEKHAAATMCAAYQAGLTGADYLWILLGDFTDDWWRREPVVQQNYFCSTEEMINAIESTLILTNGVQVQFNKERFSSILQQNQSEFWDEFKGRLENNTGLAFNKGRSIRVAQSYDAVWSISKALERTLVEENFSRSENTTNLTSFHTPRVERLHQALNLNMKNLTFDGTSGKINFTKDVNSQQHPTTTIFQMQNGVMVRVGVHIFVDSYMLNLSYFSNNLTWAGNGPPRDRPVVVQQFVEVWLVCVMLCLTFIGIVFAVVILVLNWVYRKHKVIKASSPYINIIIITGCILGFCTIPILSIENLDLYDTIPLEAYLYFCNARPWMISISITLSFGALFAKTLRVYMIFRNPWEKKRPFTDSRLIVLVGVFLVVDIVVLAIWSALFPLKLSTVIQASDNGEFSVDAYRICIIGESFENNSLLIWLAVISVVKGMVFLFGIFLVVQTSKIKAKFFQESKFVGIAIYVVVFVCAGGVPVSISLMYALEEDLGYANSVIVILLCCYLILGLVFIPRFLLLKKYKRKVPQAVLLGLNPSFRISGPRLFLSKRVPRDNGSIQKTSSTYLTESDKTLTNNSMAYLMENANNNHNWGVVTDTSMNSNLEPLNDSEYWEPAYDDESTSDEITVEVEIELQHEEVGT